MIEKVKENPIIKPDDVKPSMDGYQISGAFNPGATVYGDEILLLLRVSESVLQKEGYVRVPIYKFEGGTSHPDILEIKKDDPALILKDTRGVYYKGKDYLSTMSHIRLARSKDGINFRVDEHPFIYPTELWEEYGVEDARATKIDDRFYINYTAVSRNSWATALCETADFKNINKLGIIFHPENKDVAIFPEKVHGKYVALHRPNNSGFGKASIWYAESPDLLHWGKYECIVNPRDTMWESQKIGGGAPPIKTDEGWLIIYHGKGDNSVYSLFTLLLDLEKPNKVIKRGKNPIITPTEPYETEGFFGNVVFSNGVVEKDGKVYIYYGAADETSCVAITDVDTLLNSFD